MRLKSLNFLRDAALIVVLSAMMQVHAQTSKYSCLGMVDNVTAAPDGEVSASFSFNGGGMAWQQVCNLNANTYGVTPAACRGILTILVTARTTGQWVKVWFNNASGSSCSATAWRPLSDMGWYWGPALQSPP